MNAKEEVVKELRDSQNSRAKKKIDSQLMEYSRSPNR